MSLLKRFLESESGYADTARMASAGTLAVLVVGIAVLLATPAEAETCYGCSVPFDGCPSQGAWLCEQFAEVPCSGSPNNQNYEYFVCHIAGAGGGCQKNYRQCCDTTGCY